MKMLLVELVQATPSRVANNPCFKLLRVPAACSKASPELDIVCRSRSTAIQAAGSRRILARMTSTAEVTHER